MKNKNLLLLWIVGIIFCTFLSFSCAANNDLGGYENVNGNVNNAVPDKDTSDALEDAICGIPEISEDTDTEEYNKISENNFFNTSYQPASYFSMDSFTASYSNLRRYINNSYALPADIIKTDELINYFSYDLEKPQGDETFKISAEMSNAPWNNSHKLLTIGVTTKESTLDASIGNNIVFLIDVSGSMNTSNKIGLLKSAFSMLLDTLSDNDRISIVTYASGVNVIADGVHGDNKVRLQTLINNLKANGSTNGSGGIQRAYDIARKHFIPGGNNRIILATDGDFNVGISNQDELKTLIKEKATSGVYLTCLGFGMGNYKDTTMETLAKNGNGGYAYIDNLLEAKKVLVDEINSTLVTVAKDVKNKVEFNPNVVESYRLIGYENKQLSKEQFEDSTVDAGEVGSGHTTLVTYELVLKEHASFFEEAFNVQINYKDPISSISKTTKNEFTLASLNKETSENHKFVLCLVEFSLVLRNSKYRGTASYQTLIQRLYDLDCVKTDPFKAEFVSLVELAQSKNLIAYPSYNEELITITICTDYGFSQVNVEKNTFVNNEYILNIIFNNKIPQDRIFEIATDADYVNKYVGGYLTKNLTVYIREVTM